MSSTTSFDPIRPWNRFWFAPVSARSLGAFRIAFSLVVLGHLALLWPESRLWLSDAGYLQGTEAAELAGPWRWSPLHTYQSPLTIDAVLGAATVLSLLYLVGWHTRAVGVLLYLSLLSIHHRNLLSTSGADVLLVIVAFWMMLSPAGKSFSLDRLRSKRRGEPPSEALIAPWAQRMIQIQVSIVYFVTAILKSTGTTWANGTALYYVLANREMRRWTFGLLNQIELINLLTYSSVIIEFALAFLLWFQAARPWIILLGMALHGGICLTVNIPIFGELTIASYLLFLTPGELDSLWRWLTRRSGQTRAPLARVATTDALSSTRPETRRAVRFDQSHGSTLAQCAAAQPKARDLEGAADRAGVLLEARQGP